jgi:hypothetical protein
MADDPKGGDSGGAGGGMRLSGATMNDLGGAVADIFAYEAAGYKEQALQFEEQNYEAASQLALQNEQFTKTSTAIKEQQADRELYQSLGRTTAAVAGAGLDLSGSSLDILRESAGQGAATRAVIGQQGLITEAGYQEQANSYQNMARAAQVAENAEKTSQIGDLIGGGLKLAAAVASVIP